MNGQWQPGIRDTVTAMLVLLATILLIAEGLK